MNPERLFQDFARFTRQHFQRPVRALTEADRADIKARNDEIYTRYIREKLAASPPGRARETPSHE